MTDSLYRVIWPGQARIKIHRGDNWGYVQIACHAPEPGGKTHVNLPPDSLEAVAAELVALYDEYQAQKEKA